MSDDKSIASEAVRVLRSSDGGRMLAAALGKRVAEQLKQPLRDMLAGRRFTEVLVRELQGSITLSGKPQEIVVALSEPVLNDSSQETLCLDPSANDASSTKPRKQAFRKYDRSFWQAFIERQDRNRHRAIQLTPPFQWEDLRLSSDLPTGWALIPNDLIASPDQSWPQRKSAANLNIELWCERNHLNPDDFTESESKKLGNKLQKNSGIEKLLALIETIPIESRSRLTLSVDLVYAVISGG